MRLENSELRAFRGVLEEGGFKRAAEALHDAGTQMAQMALGQVESLSEDRGNASVSGLTDSQGQGEGGGGGGGRTENQKEEVEVPDGPDGPLGDSWSGVDAQLGSDDKKRRKMQYTDYYRKATQRYLEKVQRESKKQEGRE